MSHFLLIHGAGHGAWCWAKVIEQLRVHGASASAIDLPGHGPGATPAGLDDCIAATVAAIREIDGPVVLVGHSLGGMTISGAAEALPNRIARLVYLTALLPLDGESAMAISGSIHIAANAALGVSDDGEWIHVLPGRAPDLFYHDCDASYVADAESRLGPIHIGCGVTPVRLSRERHGSVPASYVACLQDQAIGIDAQRLMVARTPGIGWTELDASHSPFLSALDRLAETLLTVA